MQNFFILLVNSVTNVSLEGILRFLRHIDTELIGNNPQPTQHPRIMKANEKFFPWIELQPMISALRIAAVNGDVMMIRSMLQLLVPEYKPDEKVMDWVYREQIAQAGKLEY